MVVQVPGYPRLTLSISIIVATARNGIIGRDGSLPWHLPDDLKRFKEITTGHTVVVGRKTFEAIGRPLPDREVVVLTRNRGFDAEDIQVIHSFEKAIALADEREELFVAGGAEVYAHTLPLADRLYQTQVHADVEGDVSFPEISSSEWRLSSEELHDSDENHEFAFSFRSFERRKNEPAPE